MRYKILPIPILNIAYFLLFFIILWLLVPLIYSVFALNIIISLDRFSKLFYLVNSLLYNFASLLDACSSLSMYFSCFYFRIILILIFLIYLILGLLINVFVFCHKRPLCLFFFGKFIVSALNNLVFASFIIIIFISSYNRSF